MAGEETISWSAVAIIVSPGLSHVVMSFTAEHWVTVTPVTPPIHLFFIQTTNQQTQQCKKHYCGPDSESVSYTRFNVSPCINCLCSLIVKTRKKLTRADMREGDM